MEISTLTENNTTFLIFCGIILITGFILGRLLQKLIDLKNLSSVKKETLKKSRAILGGQFAEQIAPYLPEFPCNPGDVTFIGKPIDFIAFPGSAEGKEINEILFIEVKTGNSKLSERERQIKKAVESGRVKYIIYNPS